MPTEIHKNKNGTWQPIVALDYNDAGVYRSLTEVHYNDAGVWRQVFGSAVLAETLSWDTAPTGTYIANDFSVGQNDIIFDVNGFFSVSQLGNQSTSGAPLFGNYRPGLTGIDFMSYEINIDTSSVSGFGTASPIGAGTLINGTWQALSANRGISFFNADPISGGSINITVEIREIATPANTTGIASFTFQANGQGL